MKHEKKKKVNHLDAVFAAQSQSKRLRVQDAIRFHPLCRPFRAAATVHDQEDLVYQVKLAEQAERYEEIVESMKKVAGMDVELTVEEKKPSICCI